MTRLRHRFLAPIRSSAVSAVVAVVVAGAVLGACGGDAPAAQTAGSGPGDGTMSVVAAFYPLADVAAALGGADVEVHTLVGPGAEPHDFEPTAAQAEEVAHADVVLYFGGDFQQSVAKLVRETARPGTAVDVLAALGNPADPHVWLSPQAMRGLAAVVADALTGRAGAASIRIASRAGAYASELAQLDTRYRDGLARCASHELVSTHNAFAGLATYGLKAMPIAGLSPSDEPSAKDLEAVVAAAKAAKVTTVFVEEALPRDLAETVAGEIGGTTAVLNPLETLTAEQMAAGADYFSVMADNLAALRAGLGCQ